MAKREQRHDRTLTLHLTEMTGLALRHNSVAQAWMPAEQSEQRITAALEVSPSVAWAGLLAQMRSHVPASG